MKRFLSLLLVVTLVLIAATGCGDSSDSNGGGSSDETITFKLAMVDNETTNYYRGAVKIAEEVEAATDGRIKIEVVAGGTLGGERDTVELAMNGDLDIATAANSVLTNWIPEMNILDQAYLWTNRDQAHAAIDGTMGELVEESASRLGIRVIGYMESGFRDTFSTVPIDTVDDFKGIKIRTMQNEYHMAAFEAFGAMPTPMSFNEVFTALQQGSINAAENAVAGCLTNGYYEVTKHVTFTNHAYTYIMLCMSENAWNRIPEDLQDAFMEGVRRGYVAQREYLIEANEEAIEELKTLGVEFHDIDTSELQAIYKETADAKGFTFDPKWEAAAQEAINAHP